MSDKLKMTSQEITSSFAEMFLKNLAQDLRLGESAPVSLEIEIEEELGKSVLHKDYGLRVLTYKFRRKI